MTMNEVMRAFDQDVTTVAINGPEDPYRDVPNDGLPPDEDPWREVDPPRDQARAAAARPSSRLQFRSLAEVAADVDGREPRKFLFERVMVAGDYGVISAEDKAGKTFSGLDAVVSCAAGLPWLGHFECQSPGPAVAFLGEGSDAKMLRRIRAIGEHKGLTRARVDALPIRLCFRVPFLSEDGHLLEIAAELEDHPAALVLLDPLYLAAKGGKGSDLFAMGEMLGNVQRVVQPRNATLIINHHWNKTGEGSGHNRSSGVGPGAWGRFLVSVGVKSNRTDPKTQMTTVRTLWSIKGDEIADTTAAFTRRVWVDDPDDLNSAMHYSIEYEPESETGEKDTQASEAGEFRPTEAMEAISKRLENSAAPLSKNQVETTVKGFRNEVKRSALKFLVDDGYVIEERKGNSLAYRSVKAFRRDGDASGGPLLSPPGARVLAVLRAAETPIGVKRIGDEVATDGAGHPLRHDTIERALTELGEHGLVDAVEVHGRDAWVAVAQGSDAAPPISPHLAPTSPHLAPGEVAPAQDDLAPPRPTP